MLNAVIELLFFSAKLFVALFLLFLFFAAVLALMGRAKKSHGIFQIRSLNEKFQKTRQFLLSEILPRKACRALEKKEKQKEKSRRKQSTAFVLHFQGDIRASAVCSLREEVTAVLSVAKKGDEVILCLESPGGMVHAYGLATDQLLRIRKKGIRLVVVVDRVAASGGYMMACVADHLVAAPFSLIGSIGVVLQIPNFHRLLREKHIDFEQITAGKYKRTLSVFGQNTKEGREKSQEEIEAIHVQFQQLVQDHRKKADIDQVTTGEHWTGTEALELGLIDALGTSDEYLVQRATQANLLEVRHVPKKTLTEKLVGTKTRLMDILFSARLP